MSDIARQKRLFLIILLLFSLFFVVGYTSRLLKKHQVEQEVRQWQERIVQAQQKGVILQAELAHVQSEAFIHERARNVLGLVQPEDTLIVEVPRLRAAESSVSSGTEALPRGQPMSALGEIEPWQQWLQLFWPVADIQS